MQEIKLETKREANPKTPNEFLIKMTNALRDNLIYNIVLELVGRTPVVRLSKVGPAHAAEVLGKVESLNPSGSVKDRAALAMVDAAEREGTLKKGGLIVEATSGNTGISLAMISASRGYRCVIIMPEDMSIGRRNLLKSYGAEVILTPVEEGMKGAVEKALDIARKSPSAFMTRQFENPHNPDIHAHTTAEEIWQVTDGKLDVFVAGVGTGGTLTGVASVLKKKIPSIRIVAVEPKSSAVLSGGKPGLHAIQGLGAGFVPPIVDRSLIDDIITVSDLAAEKMSERLAKEEGLLVGVSAGANAFAACQVAETLKPEHRVLTILCDNGERYLS